MLNLCCCFNILSVYYQGVIYYNQEETSWYDGHWKGNKREGWGVRRYGQHQPQSLNKAGLVIKRRAGQASRWAVVFQRPTVRVCGPYLMSIVYLYCRPLETTDPFAH